MKNSLLLAIVLVCIFPALALILVEPHIVEDTAKTAPTAEDLQSEQENAGLVIVLTDAGVTKMELEEYICCVVLAEMPAEFELEALKAQSVVTRTYTCRRLSEPKHDTANVCTDESCCQAYVSCEAYVENGGTEEAVEKIRAAVEATAGEVLLYGNELIEATYFSCSGGRTEDAQAVWGTDVPYLQSVESPGEEKAAHYTDSVTFSSQAFCEKLGLSLSEIGASRIGEITYTDGGGVDTIVLGGIPYSGTQVRQLLGLRSTAFVITWAGDSVTVTTKGFGHRVGMSQYGAEAMAVQGASYDAILVHYYQGTVLTKELY